MPKKSDPVRWTFLTDLHGDEANWGVVDAALEFVDNYAPDVKIFGGDLFDFRCLRRGAGDEDKAASLKSDFAAGLEFLRRYRPHVWTMGNHDARLWLLRESPNAALAMAAEMGIQQIEDVCKELGTTIYHHDIDESFRLGSITFIHGFEHSDAGLKRESQAYGTPYVVQGHTHRRCVFQTDRGILFCSGALTNLKMRWNAARPHVRRQCNGWMAGVATEQSAVISHAVKLKGEWVCPTI